MGKYMLQVSYTAEGARGLIKEGASSRIAYVTDFAAGLGATVESFYFALGDDDAIVILDAADDSTVAAASLAVGASGACLGADDEAPHRSGGRRRRREGRCLPGTRRVAACVSGASAIAPGGPAPALFTSASTLEGAVECPGAMGAWAHRSGRVARTPTMCKDRPVLSTRGDKRS